MREGQTLSVMEHGNIYGSYVHGIFDAPGIADTMIRALCRKKGVDDKAIEVFDPEEYRNRQYDLLAEAVRSSMDMDYIYRIMGIH